MSDSSLWPAVPEDLQPTLVRLLENEFSVNSSRLGGPADLSADARAFGRLLVRSSVFYPGKELEQAKNLELPENLPFKDGASPKDSDRRRPAQEIVRRDSKV